MTITATTAGTITTTAPGVNLTVPLSQQTGTFDATTFDGKVDFAGTSGHDFGVGTASNTQTVHLTDAASLALYTGTGAVNANVTASGNSTASGMNSLTNDATTTGQAQISVIYHYTLNNCLAPGQYTIVQTNEPPNTTNGRQSSNGTLLPPNTSGGPDTIPVTLSNQNLVNNNFGEFPPGINGLPGGTGGGGTGGTGGTGTGGTGTGGTGTGGIPVPQGLGGPVYVVGTQRLGIHHQQTRFVLRFNTQLAPATARNLAHYHLVMVNRNGKASGQPIPLQSAIYNPTNLTVELIPTRQLNVHFHYRLTVTGLTDPFGDKLTGSARGGPGSPFVTVFTKNNLTFPASPNAVARAVALAHRSLFSNGTRAVRIP